MSRLAWLGFILASCSGNDGDSAVVDAPIVVFHDAPIVDAPQPDGFDLQACLAIRAQWAAKVALIGDACQVDSDCVAVGGFSTQPGCASVRVQIAETFLDCTGTPVNAAGAAAAHDELAALEAAFHACIGTSNCAEVPGFFPCSTDCPTGSKPVCNAAQRCALQRVASCPPFPQDAAVADGS